MAQYVAFLRAINVGGHTVKMADLRQWFIEMGLSNVETFIQSGNVIFEAAGGQIDLLERRIEAGLKEKLGYGVAAFIRTLTEVDKLIEAIPFPEAEFDAGADLYVAFLHESPMEEAQQRLISLRNAIDDFAVNRREVFWLRRKQVGASLFSGAVLEKTLKAQATLRNITTLKRMAAKQKPG